MSKLEEHEVRELLGRIPGWELHNIDGVLHLSRLFEFEDFSQALAFTVRTGLIAEKADHHPKIVLEWGRVRVDWWSHALEGVGEMDIEMAARTDALVICEG
ncbi:4a-hydroxytetrahydrobiopterin dehydratase [Prosthecochloris sp. HL-130-GSB]|jgi:4a-hydroxytetrahydrobiopterin dehydratase|uniref:4a-hydroxytetrahydrobiopterin dehydratase n=1 Tax=Prosthecochloris sp. HL-130-GSB TaxID=1974213 RepID=UPI000A1C11D3|nr:4a-hydroxytetrahydrobiopterin dehydratase [Prosthecochloris sp. HL-130-GSB]ARM30527.1 hypothetical protein B9H02_03290 [Prosthecochloris sp. HL-130-GSB]MBO8093433.1 4a-hydroxytetrahydrobiopterin dehydratase [Prosthecochloris sp.]